VPSTGSSERNTTPLKMPWNAIFSHRNMTIRQKAENPLFRSFLHRKELVFSIGSRLQPAWELYYIRLFAIPSKRVNCHRFSWPNPLQENVGEYLEYQGLIIIRLSAIAWYVYSGSIKVKLQRKNMDF
jgi:hypothetical protein